MHGLLKLINTQSKPISKSGRVKLRLKAKQSFNSDRNPKRGVLFKKENRQIFNSTNNLYRDRKVFWFLKYLASLHCDYVLHINLEIVIWRDIKN